MKLEHQRVPPAGVGTLMYVGDGEATSSVSIDAVKVGAGIGLIWLAFSRAGERAGGAAQTALAVLGALVAKRGVTVR